MKLFRITALLLFLAWCPLASAQTLNVSDEERALLGIELQQAVSQASGSTGEITLRVGFSPDAEWAIKTPFPGILHRAFVLVGDRVSSGEPLMTVRSSEIAAIQRDFLKAEADWKLQKSAWERDKKLKDAGSVSSRRWQETQFAYTTARAEYAGLRAQLQFAGYSEDDITLLSRNMDVTSDIVLRAPADALVLERPAMLGDHLEGTEMLARLGDTGKLVLTGMLSRTAAANLEEGASLVLQGAETRAVLVFVSSVIDPDTQTVHVRAEPLDLAGLKPGQLTRWNVQSGSPVLTVPSSAIVKLDGEDVVYVQVAGGFEPRVLEARNAGGGSWIVLKGLRSGEVIAVSGTAVLKGMSVGMGGGDG